MPALPRETAFDSTLALLADPYRFIAKGCERHRSDLFEARILLRRTVCMSGPITARLFYDPRRFARHGAEHQHLEAMFVGLLTPEHVAELANEVAEQWRAAADRWRGWRRVPLCEAVQTLLMRAVCRWAGVPLPEHEVALRTRQLGALFDRAGAWRHLQARRARHQAEAWAEGLVRQVRTKHLLAARQRPLGVVASHLTLQGELLPPRVAAVELLNLLRPVVAVSVYITFAAYALHEYPQWMPILKRGHADDLRCFVQEVRRFYPFFPALAARARDEFEWHGYSFRQGQRVLFDLYGTNHDVRCWDEPHAFRPERFRDRTPGPFEFVAQGGSEPLHQHRCPGEGLTVALMTVSVDHLARRLGYDVPPQDLRIDFARLPALPRSHFVMRDVTPLPHPTWPNFAFTPS